MESAKLDESAFLTLPYGKVLEVYASRPDKELIDSAMISVGVALGNDPSMLTRDKSYNSLVHKFVTVNIASYVEKAAAVQLGLFSLGGKNSTQNTLSGFAPELEKVRAVVIPNERAAEAILRESNRLNNFLLAVTSMTALYCKKNREVGSLFGLKKPFFGPLKFNG